MAKSRNNARLGKKLAGTPRSGEVSGLTGLALSIIERAAIDISLGGAIARDAQLFLRSPGCERLLDEVLALMGNHPQAARDLLAQYRRNGRG